MTESSNDIEILGEIAGIAIAAAYRNVEIIAWHRTATLEVVERLLPATQQIARRHPQGFSAFHIVSRTAGVPTRDARERLITIGKQFTSQTIAVAVVLDHTGFAASALRSLVTTMTLLIRPRHATAVYRNIGEAAQWLATQHAKRGTPLDSAELEAAALCAYQWPEPVNRSRSVVAAAG